MTGIRPSLNCPARAQARVGDRFSLAVSANGSPLPRVTVQGLPLGLTAWPSVLGRVTISGTPLASGSRTVKITAQNSTGETSHTLDIEVQPRLVARMGTTSVTARNIGVTSYTPDVMPLGTSVMIFPRSMTVDKGSPVYVRISAAGSPGWNLSVQGQPPRGVKTRVEFGCVVLSGSPISSGTYEITINAAKEGRVTPKMFTLIVRPRLRKFAV